MKLVYNLISPLPGVAILLEIDVFGTLKTLTGNVTLIVSNLIRRTSFYLSQLLTVNRHA